MVDNYDDLDEMTGSMKDWVSKKQGASVMARITPNMLFMVVKQKENGCLFDKSKRVRKAKLHL